MKRLELFLMVFQVPLDFLLLLAAATTAFVLRSTPYAVSIKPILFSLSLVDFLFIAIPVSAVLIGLFALHGLYTPSARRFAKDIINIFSATATGLAIIALYLLFTQQQFDSRFLLVISWVVAVIYIILGRLLMRGVKSLCYRFGIGLRRIVIIGSGTTKDILLQEITQNKRLGYVVVGTYDNFASSIISSIKQVYPDVILYANPRSNENEALNALAFANENHIAFNYSADLFATFTANMSVHPLAGIPVVEVRRAKIEGWGKVVKRVYDILFSLFAIILFSPIFILTAVAIKIDSRGPVLFRYERIGQYGKKMKYIKFRSMIDKAHDLRYDPEFRKSVTDTRGWSSSDPMVKFVKDPRITRVGAFIRRFSIDELPEFFLVLSGTMSVVGPRPHEIQEVEKYQAHHKALLSIKPGITGLAQISGRSDLSFEDEVRLNVLYMERWSLWLDIIICLKTPFILFKKRKAL